MGGNRERERGGGRASERQAGRDAHGAPSILPNPGRCVTRGAKIFQNHPGKTFGTRKAKMRVGCRRVAPRNIPQLLRVFTDSVSMLVPWVNSSCNDNSSLIPGW